MNTALYNELEWAWNTGKISHAKACEIWAEKRGWETPKKVDAA